MNSIDIEYLAHKFSSSVIDEDIKQRILNGMNDHERVELSDCIERINEGIYDEGY